MSEWRRSTVAAVRCLARGVPLFFSASPRTPLRVLGIIALDTLHLLRHSQTLPRHKIRELALFLDFEGCINARWDRKVQSDRECESIRQRLEAAGYAACIETYLGRLRDLERGRPAVGGDRTRFAEVRTYREEVARLALVTAAAIALHPECHGVHITTAESDADIDTLFRILMQCQIIDDVLDYSGDLSAGLPTFLTASAHVSQAIKLTTDAAHEYGAIPRRRDSDIFPIRITLTVVTTVAALLLRFARQRQRLAGQVAHR